MENPLVFIAWIYYSSVCKTVPGVKVSDDFYETKRYCNRREKYDDVW